MESYQWSSLLLNSMKPSSMSQSSSQTVKNQILSWLLNYNFLSLLLQHLYLMNTYWEKQLNHDFAGSYTSVWIWFSPPQVALWRPFQTIIRNTLTVIATLERALAIADPLYIANDWTTLVLYYKPQEFETMSRAVKDEILTVLPDLMGKAVCS